MNDQDIILQAIAARMTVVITTKADGSRTVRIAPNPDQRNAFKGNVWEKEKERSREVLGIIAECADSRRSARSERNRRYYEKRSASKSVLIKTREASECASESVLTKTPPSPPSPPSSPPFPSPPLSPTPPIPAPTHAPTPAPTPEAPADFSEEFRGSAKRGRPTGRQALIDESRRTSETTVIPKDLESEQFRTAWREFCDWRERLTREQKHPWSEVAARNVMRTLADIGHDWALAELRAATGQWKSINIDARRNPADVRNKPILPSQGGGRFGPSEADRRAAVMQETRRIRSMLTTAKPAPVVDRVTLDDLRAAKENLSSAG